MTFKVLAVAGLASVALTGCGGGGAAKPDRVQVQDTTRAFIGALVDNDNAKACTFTTDRGKCLGELAMASAFLGQNGSWKTLFSSGWEAQMEKARITINGDSAVMAAWSASGSQTNDPTDFKKVNGTWLIVLDSKSSSAPSASQDGQASQPVAPATLKTDAQAEAYVKTLKTWAGVNLTKADFVDAFCENGYYSKTETRTGKHLPGNTDQTNAAGEDVFPSFACDLSVDSRSFHLYVVPQADGTWTVTADR
jgi:hypothetical protein